MEAYVNYFLVFTSFLMVCKIILHLKLDIANRYKVVLAPASSWVYFLPYKKAVKNQKLKLWCNIFYVSFLSSLGILFVLLALSQGIKN
jgi:hypothetical protein